MAPLNQDERDRIAKLFNQLDVDKDGRVSVAELVRVMQNTSENSDDRLKTAERIIQSTATGDEKEQEKPTMSFDQFLRYVHDTETQLRLAFNQIDRNKDGEVDAEEIQATMKELGLSVKIEDARRLLKQMDKDGSLKIDYNEWKDFLLFSGTTEIEKIFRYWRHASAIDIGENMLVPDDFTEKEKKTGEAWKTLVAGGIAGCLSRTATAPLDRIKLTWQALGSKAAQLGLSGTVKKMVKEGGIHSLWRGNGVNCLKIAPETAFKFQAYELYKQWLGPHLGMQKDGPVNLQTKFLAGAFAGATAQTIIYPMEVLKTRMCLRKSGQYSSIFDCARKLHHENGWRIFYRGYIPNLLGILPYAGIELALFETFKQTYCRLITSEDAKAAPPPVYVSVTAGALSSVCGQLGTYPLALIRTKLQAQTAGSDKIGFIQLTGNIIKHEGLTGLFRGLGPNMLKVIPAVSLSYACYDQLRQIFHISK